MWNFRSIGKPFNQLLFFSILTAHVHIQDNIDGLSSGRGEDIKEIRVTLGMNPIFIKLDIDIWFFNKTRAIQRTKLKDKETLDYNTRIQ